MGGCGIMVGFGEGDGGWGGFLFFWQSTIASMNDAWGCAAGPPCRPGACHGLDQACAQAQSQGKIRCRASNVAVVMSESERWREGKRALPQPNTHVSYYTHNHRATQRQAGTASRGTGTGRWARLVLPPLLLVAHGRQPRIAAARQRS
jgi:hypothetical protein